MQVIKYDQVQEKIINVRNQQVIIDSDVAELYGLDTKRVNEAVNRNPDKFPEGYLIQFANSEVKCNGVAKVIDPGNCSLR